MPDLLRHVASASSDFLEMAQFIEEVVGSLDNLGDGTISKCVTQRAGERGAVVAQCCRLCMGGCDSCGAWGGVEPRRVAHTQERLCART